MISRSQICSVLALTALAIPLSAFAGTKLLKLKLVQGTKVGYRVAMDSKTFTGTTSTVTETVSNQIPISIQIDSVSGNGAMLSVTKGPLSARGRSVGRSKTSTETIDAGGSAGGRAPANFFVCLPVAGAKIGQSWRSGFFGGPPLPAGMQAVYKYSGVSGDGRFAIVDILVNAQGASKLQGKGKLFLRLSDGFLDHGSAVFTVSYLRPDTNDRNKMVVNSRVVTKYTFTAG